jgi:putative hydrolase of the HAD superfamily
MAWLVCDYGNVISRTPTPGDVERLAELCKLDVEAFTAAYWVSRIEYDRGDLDAIEYWRGIAQGSLTPELLDELVDADIASWIRLDKASVAAVEAAEARGHRLALLSNAPIEIARVLDLEPWFARFSPRLFSCDLRLTKPDPAIYRVLLDRLGSPAAEVVFVDDRQENVEGAAALGIRALLYTSPETFAAI